MTRSIPLLVLLLAACGGAKVSTPKPADLAMADGSGTLCQAGAVQTCNCLGGSTGLQTCRANGASYGPCIACGDGGTSVLSTDMAVTSGSPCGDCDGCCNGTTCIAVASEGDGQCGTRTSCAACGSGTTCTNGTCMSSSTPTCTGCDYGTLCSNGQCTENIDPNAMFKMTVTEIVLAATDDGSEWDPPEDKAPDPFLCITFTYNGQTQNGCNLYCDTVYDCTPAPADGLVGNSDGSVDATSPLYIPGSIITQGAFTIDVYDYDDFSSNDLGGEINYTSPTYMNPFTLPAFQSVTKVTFKLD